MPEMPLSPISAQERRQRLRRIRNLAKALGFAGKVEYRHEKSGTGGAQYRRAIEEEDDRLIVFSEAFERDADLTDFSLSAILAHERGHQLLARNPRIQRVSERAIHPTTEEILASVIGSLIAETEDDRETLFSKACFDALAADLDLDRTVRLLHELRDLFGRALYDRSKETE